MGIQRWTPTGSEIDLAENGEFVLFTDHERVVGELDRLVRNVETENEFLSHALAESRTEVEKIRGYEVSPLQAKNAELRAEIDGLVKDAGRWVFVREQHGVTVSVEEADDDGDMHFCSGHSPEQLDAAIDAAMEEQAE